MSDPLANTLREIPIDLIRPGQSQARKHFSPEAISELARSIHQSGIIQPLIVRTRGAGYELLAGERRWRAAQQAGLHTVPAVLRDDLSDSEAEVFGLIENLQRESLSPIETAAGLRRIAELYGLTHEVIGARIGKSRAFVTNHLRLLGLVQQVQDSVDAGLLSLGHAKVLAGLAPLDQAAFAVSALREHWSVRTLERRVSAGTRAVNQISGDAIRLQNEVADHLGYPVKLSMREDGAGEIAIKFHSLDELDGLLARLGLNGR